MRLMLSSLAVCAMLLPVTGLAQDLSEDELLELFLAQRDAYKAAVEGNTSLTRGLTLVTADDVTVSTEVATETEAPPDTEAVEITTADPVADPAADPELVTTAATETVIATSETATLVKMPADLGVNVSIEFAFDSAALDDAQKPKLQKLCNVMKKADIQLFRIIGHTDASGSDDYNERLSRLRAEEVQRFFVNECGIAATRLEAVGLGERFLLENSDPDSDENRRVEFQALS
jgi:outer membrane protein OmpA-like peptidoglycan-associated protein